MTEDSKRSIPSPFLNAPRRNVPQRSQDRKRYFHVRADSVPEQFKNRTRFNLSSIPIPEPVVLVEEEKLVFEEEFVGEEPLSPSPAIDEEQAPKKCIDREKVFGSLPQGLEVEIPFRSKNSQQNNSSFSR